MDTDPEGRSNRWRSAVQEHAADRVGATAIQVRLTTAADETLLRIDPTTGVRDGSTPGEVRSDHTSALPLERIADRSCARLGDANVDCTKTHSHPVGRSHRSFVAQEFHNPIVGIDEGDGVHATQVIPDLSPVTESAFSVSGSQLLNPRSNGTGIWGHDAN